MAAHVCTTVAFGLALEVAPTGMMRVDDLGRIVLLNAHVEALFGYDRCALVGRQMKLLVPAGVGGATGPAREAIGRHRDGHPLPLEVANNPLDTPDGRARFPLAFQERG